MRPIPDLVRLPALAHRPGGSPVPPAADRIEDVRDPAAARDILDLDGLDHRVQGVVLAPPGARELLANLADLPAGLSRIAIGCAGRTGRPARGARPASPGDNLIAVALVHPTTTRHPRPGHRAQRTSRRRRTQRRGQDDDV